MLVMLLLPLFLPLLALLPLLLLNILLPLLGLRVEPLEQLVIFLQQCRRRGSLCWEGPRGRSVLALSGLLLLPLKLRRQLTTLLCLCPRLLA